MPPSCCLAARPRCACCGGLTGLPCPACGGTTAMVALGRGQWGAALAASPLVVLGARCGCCGRVGGAQRRGCAPRLGRRSAPLTVVRAPQPASSAAAPLRGLSPPHRPRRKRRAHATPTATCSATAAPTRHPDGPTAVSRSPPSGPPTRRPAGRARRLPRTPASAASASSRGHGPSAPTVRPASAPARTGTPATSTASQDGGAEAGSAVSSGRAGTGPSSTPSGPTDVPAPSAKPAGPPRRRPDHGVRHQRQPEQQQAQAADRAGLGALGHLRRGADSRPRATPTSSARRRAAAAAPPSVRSTPAVRATRAGPTRRQHACSARRQRPRRPAAAGRRPLSEHGHGWSVPLVAASATTTDRAGVVEPATPRPPRARRAPCGHSRLRADGRCRPARQQRARPGAAPGPAGEPVAPWAPQDHTVRHMSLAAAERERVDDVGADRSSRPTTTAGTGTPPAAALSWLAACRRAAASAPPPVPPGSSASTAAPWAGGRDERADCSRHRPTGARRRGVIAVRL
jgi:hypothetical protein